MGFLDSILGGGDGRDAAREELDRVPELSEADLRVQLEPLVQQGIITPEQAEVYLLDPSAFAELMEDPTLRSAQLDALSEYGVIADEGGLDARGRADIYNVRQEQQTENRGQQEAILADARARGIGGSNLELAARLQAQQGAANRSARAGSDIAASSMARRDDALARQAGLAGNIRGQDYQRSSQAAAAADEIKRFNAQQLQSQANRAVGDRNAAQAQNLSEKQRVADASTDIRNEQEIRNARVPLDVFQARRGLAGDKADLALGESAADEKEKDRLLNLGVSAAAIFAASDERVKKDVRPIDSRKILQDLTGSTWEYRGTGEPAMGVMAQDLEQTPMGDAVVEGPGGMKMINYGSMGVDAESGGPILALLADMDKRLRQVEV